ncbi:hypothetical protein O7600_14010 [Micromonospora sp. WMMA1998]|uniref:hypothetical protein n=1 Tax=Micromonospora sp. WMMA1998 TaxID=3015167 RepID=UPI00248B55A8|nr:hypothetical protein [Micromonospora sp. WMMA1998]WBC17859.1 hypothetical protein O7600_14010 [Micromonospora sp. WMMA1998]
MATPVAAELVKAAEISVGDVLRAVGGTLTSVRGMPADRTGYHGVATGLRGPGAGAPPGYSRPGRSCRDARLW